MLLVFLFVIASENEAIQDNKAFYILINSLSLVMTIYAKILNDDLSLSMNFYTVINFIP